MKYIAMFILIATLVVFSFGGLFIMNGMTHRDCVAANFDRNNTECPTNLLASISHHTFIFQIFSSIPSINFTLLLGLILALVSLIFILNFGIFDLTLGNLSRYLRETFDKICSSSRKFIFWISLLEHSPSH